MYENNKWQTSLDLTSLLHQILRDEGRLDLRRHCDVYSKALFANLTHVPFFGGILMFDDQVACLLTQAHSSGNVGLLLAMFSSFNLWGSSGSPFSLPANTALSHAWCTRSPTRYVTLLRADAPAGTNISLPTPSLLLTQEPASSPSCLISAMHALLWSFRWADGGTRVGTAGKCGSSVPSTTRPERGP